MQKYEQGFWVSCRPNYNVLRALIPKCFWYVRVFKIVHAVQAYVYSFHTARHLSCCEIVVWWCVCTQFFTVIWFIILFTKFVDTWNNPCWRLPLYLLEMIMEKSLYGISIFIREIIAHFSHIFELNNGRPPRHHYVNMGGEHFLVCVFNRLWSANVCFFSGMDAFWTNFYCLSINNDNECHTEYCPFLTFIVSYTRDVLSFDLHDQVL